MHLDEAAVARFVQGLRSSEDAREIRKHLSGCADCRKKVSEFGQIRDVRAPPHAHANGKDAKDEATRGLPPARPPPLPGRDKDDDAATAALPKDRDRPKVTPMPSITGATEDDGRRTMPIPNAEPAPQLERGAMLGRYLVLHQLGEGGMGVVYSAYDPELDRKVAVKLISAGASEDLAGDGQQRLLREAQAMARVSHPNVIAVYDVGTLNNRVFVAMELVEGGTLKDWIRAKKRGTREILTTFVDAGHGLAAAHAVGLVHRDFKPENVLISKKDGRVQVTDFGLARLAGSAEEQQRLKGAALTSLPKRIERSGDERGRLLDAQITQHGLVMGTPQYMSPEQHLGKDPDARSDQFSFCAALYWALYGKRPFDPVQLAAAAVKLDEADDKTRAERSANPQVKASIGKGVIAEPPKEVKVPSDVKKAILRGLSVDPAQRYPSMEELLKRLAPREKSAQRLWVAGVVGVVAIAVPSAIYVFTKSAVCSGAEDKMVGVWDQARKDAIQKQFSATNIPIAAEAYRLTAASLDEYSRSWITQRTDACIATRVRGDQTDKILELRQVCLERRLKELRGLVDLLTQADKELVDRAYNSDFTGALSSLKSCADVELLTNQVSVPQDPAVQAKIEAVRGKLSDARARWAAGQFKPALQISDGAAASAREVGYNPVLSEALYVQARLEDQLGQSAQAVKTLLQAIRAGEAGRQDESRAESMVQMVSTLHNARQYEQALQWGDLAQGVLDRLSGHEEAQADLAHNTGRALTKLGQWSEALKYEQKALGLFEKYAANSYKRAKVLDGIGNIYDSSDDPKIRDPDKAIGAYLQATAIYEKTKGKRHPLGMQTHLNLVNAYLGRNDFQNAQEHAELAYQVALTYYGPESRRARDAMEALAPVYYGLKKYPQALDTAQRACALNAKFENGETGEMRYCMMTIGRSLIALNRPADAIPAMEKDVKWWEGEKGVDPDDVGTARFLLAQALRDAKKDPERAVALATRAREDFLSVKSTQKAQDVEKWLRVAPSLEKGGRKRGNTLGSRDY
ncbi:MAG TPA: protein kinase [Myxococcaceae bacterium]|nr:protein kinase [Myxococcaceae bacterium]